MSATEKVEKALMRLVDFYSIQKEKKLHNNIVVQGRSAAAASEFQLNLAKELFANARNKKVLVDYPISFKYKNESRKPKKKNAYADVIVTESGFLKGVMEVKIDLGFLNYKRYGLKKKNGIYFYERSSNKFKHDYDKLFNSKELKYKYPVGFKTFDYKTIVVPRDNNKIIRVFLLVTKQNDHNRFDAFKKAIEDSGFRFLCLLDRLHPNEHPETTDLRKWSSEMKRRIRNEVRKNGRIIGKAFQGL